MIAVLLALVLLALPAAAQESPFDAAGYRVRDFRAETGTTPPPGAATVDTAALHGLLAGGAIPVDVLPTPPRPPTLREGALWMPQERRNIPGTLWLPDLGLPALSAVQEARFRDALEPARRSGRPVVAYCLKDCWLSWNAARRLAEWGFPDVRWYPGGTEEWTAAGHPVAPATPAVPPQAGR
ncbi:rhodanese-like domain-containing protein [Azospirillum halopraeferens]|uniref:rhodanese-like domain-containing protein n=1 Tax=Azospirillum halopraeferens TaxID=34010 RepID=UPI000410F626|nr:rhodanese-like domain-containing protein [Azospirillum halopraeferens]